MTAILHCGLSNCFSRSFTFHTLLGRLYPFSIWTFISFIYLIFFSVWFHFNYSSISVLFKFFLSSFSTLFQFFFILSWSHFGFLPIFFMIHWNHFYYKLTKFRILVQNLVSSPRFFISPSELLQDANTGCLILKCLRGRRIRNFDNFSMDACSGRLEIWVFISKMIHDQHSLWYLLSYNSIWDTL